MTKQPEKQGNELPLSYELQRFDLLPSVTNTTESTFWELLSRPQRLMLPQYGGPISNSPIPCQGWKVWMTLCERNWPLPYEF